MDEIFEITDRITIFRDGNYIDTKNTNDLDKNSLIALMVGREIENIFPEKVTFKQERTFEPYDIPKPEASIAFEKVEEAVEVKAEVVVEETVFKPESTETKIRRSFFDKYVDKIKEFLDNAE